MSEYRRAIITDPVNITTLLSLPSKHWVLLPIDDNNIINEFLIKQIIFFVLEESVSFVPSR